MDKSFLAKVAASIYEQQGHHLNQVVMVFPNKRARLFFNQALYEVAGRPVWTPQYLGIADLWAQCRVSNAQGQPWTLGDPIYLNGLLFEEYSRIFSESKGSFDDFYAWGKVLLRDFDNIDRNLADAKALFRLVGETLSLQDNFEHLSEEQKQLIQSFFGNFKPKDEEEVSQLKKNFIQLWNRMYALYQAFKLRLDKEALVYSSMLTREIVENWERYSQNVFNAKLYAFVGFNALNPCEEKLFGKFKEEGKALFFWDYDHYYLDNELDEAGYFMRRNLQRFPNALQDDFNALRQRGKSIEIIASAGENAQVHYAAGDWLQRHSDSHSAVVLCNEALLLPMLHALPEDIKEFNITMGYPMTQSPVYHLLQEIVQLHSEGRRSCRCDGPASYRSQYVLPLLQNSIVGRASSPAGELAALLQDSHGFSCSADELTGQNDELLRCLFKPVETPAELGDKLLEAIRLLADAEQEQARRACAAAAADAAAAARPAQEAGRLLAPLYQESLFLCHQAIEQLQQMLTSGLIQLNFATYRRLLAQVLNLSIPFSGEPLGGVQLMGLLETRNLDFDHLLILSANEGNLPRDSQESSFIPYHLRQAFGLTLPQHQEAISAYYFMRMLQRAQDITICYSNVTKGDRHTEKSRFLLQLQMESGLDIKSSFISGKNGDNRHLPPLPRKGVSLPQVLSPSSLKNYISCEAKFYYANILKLKPIEEPDEDMDAAVTGTIFHSSMQYLYTETALRKANRPHATGDVLKAMADKTGDILPIIVEKEDIKAIQGDGHLREVLELFTQMHYFKSIDPYGQALRSPEKRENFGGNLLLKLNIQEENLKRTLHCDASQAPFELLAMELKVGSDTALQIDAQTSFGTHGIIDRIDYKEGRLRIVDYKTGRRDPKTLIWDKVFSTRASSYELNAMQVHLYAMLLQKHAAGPQPDPDTTLPQCLNEKLQQADTALQTVLFYPLAGDYAKTDSHLLKFEGKSDFRAYQEDFRAALQDFLYYRYFHSDHDNFERCDNTKTCEYCDFRHLCRR